jgi:hypothetical protein
MLNVWEYETATSEIVQGAMLGFSDHGGTDVTYRFHRLDGAGRPIRYDNGGILMDCVSGSRLKAARRIGNREAPGG